MKMKSKRAAMEMSVGTMVTIVLLMTVLILGLVFVRTIFKSASGAIDLTDQQLRDEIQKLFSGEKSLAIYPSTRLVEIRQEEREGVGIGIKNLVEGSQGSNIFSYEVSVEDASRCGNANVEDWIEVGKSASSISLRVGDFTSRKVLFRIPTGTPLCTARFSVNVKADGEDYENDFFDIVVKAK